MQNRHFDWVPTLKFSKRLETSFFHTYALYDISLYRHIDHARFYFTKVPIQAGIRHIHRDGTPRIPRQIETQSKSRTFIYLVHRRCQIKFSWNLRRNERKDLSLLESPKSPCSRLYLVSLSLLIESIHLFLSVVVFCWYCMNVDLAVYESFCLAHSGQMMSSPSVMKPRPTSDELQPAQMKQSLCQCLSSNEMKRVPPIPEHDCNR